MEMQDALEDVLELDLAVIRVLRTIGHDGWHVGRVVFEARLEGLQLEVVGVHQGSVKI